MLRFIIFIMLSVACAIQGQGVQADSAARDDTAAAVEVGMSETVLTNLPKLTLTNKPFYIPGGMSATTGMVSDDTKVNRHYFSIENGAQNIRVNYLATNLAQQVKPVKQAYDLLQTYKKCRIIAPILAIGGIGTGIAIFALHPGDASGPNFPPIIIGTVISLSSWIPVLIAKNQVEESVCRYNEKISKLK